MRRDDRRIDRAVGPDQFGGGASLRGKVARDNRAQAPRFQGRDDRQADGSAADDHGHMVPFGA
jgi:hypothetical protein